MSPHTATLRGPKALMQSVAVLQDDIRQLWTAQGVPSDIQAMVLGRPKAPAAPLRSLQPKAPGLAIPSLERER